ncbi:hypothetical protein [Pedobacter hartonius]|uniref:Uncharacterized protein n=1 Tax=Pedobacter hartonius TaxID=425514 RepID=A0A1H4HKK4_9SPHI|nr:hypothetical protein [Pedobacter hartonius]SEB22389.1 hypothetical protein SAMN05443550_1351 [Pedobacter hartonius]
MDNKYKNRHWYAYVDGNPLNPENYQLTTITPWCTNGKNLCAIYTIGYDEQPEEFSPKMKMVIANALVTGVPQPIGSEVLLVLMKN